MVNCDPAFNLPSDEYYYRPVEPIVLQNGLVFASHDAAVERIEKWDEENFFPLTKARFTKAGFTKTNPPTCFGQERFQMQPLDEVHHQGEAKTLKKKFKKIPHTGDIESPDRCGS